jgi:hypothetical protein
MLATTPEYATAEEVDDVRRLVNQTTVYDSGVFSGAVSV